MALTKIALKDRCWTRRTILQRVEAIDVSITVGRLKVLSPRMTHFRNDRYPSFFNYPGHVMLYMQFFQMYAIMMLCGSCEICFNNAERPFETKSLRITAAEHVMFFVLEVFVNLGVKRLALTVLFGMRYSGSPREFIITYWQSHFPHWCLTW